MTSNAEYFARYEAIAAISRRMLMAARRALWNDLVHLQEEYRKLVDGLRDAETSVRLDDTERVRKYALIRQILADDAAIRDLANPRMVNLSALFAGRPTRVLKELYGAR
ncbi:flagellar protein FliT [Paraburkholderia phytofirmans]|uniref:Flagellar protein FliT n=1 Tax=Paraburkholderia phytofirmans OLGA172 TaxID=1417228 RepID=A0A160FNV5_9BURK|nr:flagellar protein FliT [Paraburkholderia phytofirmans]ANB74301.1 flagellar biosynthesis protein FliT [Paraburkholderia phytofirmans OLGA172]